MSASPEPPAGHGHRFGLTTAIAWLAAYNVVRSLWIPESWQLLTNVLAAVGVMEIGFWAGLSATELGLRERRLRSGALWGGLAALVVLVALGGFAIVTAVRGGSSGGALVDPRLRVGWRDMLYEVFVNTPVGTVLLEEMAFRGVLLALLRRRMRTWYAVLGCSLLFGSWHILPTITTATANGALSQVAATPGGLVLVVVGNVLATGTAGVVFCWLRLRSGSLLAPMLAHLAVNDISFLTGWLENR